VEEIANDIVKQITDLAVECKYFSLWNMDR
jgi:hypothetical protein